MPISFELAENSGFLCQKIRQRHKNDCFNAENGAEKLPDEICSMFCQKFVNQKVRLETPPIRLLLLGEDYTNFRLGRVSKSPYRRVPILDCLYQIE